MVRILFWKIVNIMVYRHAIVIVAAFFAASTFWMFLPLLSVSLRHEGVSDLGVGIMSGLPWVGVLITSSLVPLVTRSFGLKYTIVIGMCLSLLAFLGFAGTRNVGLWALLCLLMGSALSLRWAGMDTWINGSFPDHLRGKLTGLYELIMSGSIAFGPAVLALSGDTGYLPFLVAALVLAVSASVTGIVGQESAQARQQGTLPSRRFEILFHAPAAFIGIFVVGLTEAVNLSLLPLFGLSSGFSVHGSALLVVMVQAGGALGALLIGGLADHLNRLKLSRFCACLLVVLPVGLILDLHQALWPWLMFWGAVQGGLFTLGIISLSTRHSGLGLASAMTFSMVVYTVGGIVGPPILGGLISLFGGDGFVFGLTAVALAGAWFVLRAPAA